MKIFTTLALCFVCVQLFGQVRKISGTLTSNDGEPLPGVSITIKGTNIGTTTDANGYYAIDASVGETLMFSFIGMTTREIVVTADNFENSSPPVRADKKRKRTLTAIPRSLYNDSITPNIPGVSILTDETPTYHSKSLIDPSTVRSIKRLGKGYNIITDRDPIKRKGFHAQFSTTFSLEHVTQMPPLQNSYAQGQPQNGQLVRRGPDQNEIYSWGPLIRTLEFDGNDYAYDKYGKLVSKPNGNGKDAIVYNPNAFFSTGMSVGNELLMVFPGPKRSTIVLDAEHNNSTSVIPNSWYQKVNLSASLKNVDISNKLRANSALTYNESHGSLLSHGANYASIIGGVFRTPPTFDNSNGYPPGNAHEFHETYRLSNGSARSHAPGLADNPYGLVGELPDHDHLRRLLGSLNVTYKAGQHFDINFNGNIDQQWSDNTFGVPPGYVGFFEGRMTQRHDNQNFLNAVITPHYTFNDGDHQVKFSLSYQTQYTNRDFQRKDGYRFDNYESIASADSSVSLTYSHARLSHDITFATQYRFAGWLNIRLSNRSYFSSTVDRSRYTNIFPAGSISVDLHDLLDLWDINALTVYASASSTLREAPLMYTDWAYASTRDDIEDYSTFYEAGEIFHNAALLPERDVKFETGLTFRTFSELRIYLTYFHNTTEDYIAPVWNNGSFNLENIASTKNYGGTIGVEFYHQFGDVTWDSKVGWSKYKNLATEVYGTTQVVPLSGFRTAQTVVTPGHSVGAIYGTTYQRNALGEVVIGPDGFPLEDTQLKVIGNPIPDWALGWSSKLRWRRWHLSFLFDFKRGGDVWNGTSAVLDYLGKSASTADLRNTANFVFEGVDFAGNPNVIPVDFADRSKPVNENRWVRYGWDGVGEEYIEDASWVRLNELGLSYTLRLYRNNPGIKSVTFSVVANNVFLITPYSGVDPNTSLFGYSAGSSLDLFNAPATRRISAQITIKI